MVCVRAGPVARTRAQAQTAAEGAHGAYEARSLGEPSFLRGQSLWRGTAPPAQPRDQRSGFLARARPFEAFALEEHPCDCIDLAASGTKRDGVGDELAVGGRAHLSLGSYLANLHRGDELGGRRRARVRSSTRFAPGPVLTPVPARKRDHGPI